MLYNLLDTIVAISTPKGTGGIGVVRLSGYLSFEIACKVCNRKNIKIGINYASFFCKDKFLIDRGLILFFKSPNSFTGEDVIEFHAHGNDLILESIIFRCVELGARIAYNGEYSFRAYINGKIDLVQAESINSLIKSTSTHSNKFILKSLCGKISEKVKIVLDKLNSIKLDLEVAIEFPDNFNFNSDLFFSNIFDVSNFYNSFFACVSLDDFLFNSLNVIILGNVNVGKSSLFNCLLNNNRAIVSDIPGTTRDFIDSDFFLNGFKFKLIDTAGFNPFTQDYLEKVSIARTLNEAKKANILIFVIDVIDNVDFVSSEEFNSLINMCVNKLKVIVFRNKIDLLELGKKIYFYDKYVEIFGSVKNNDGIDFLLKELSVISSDLNENLFFVNKRQFDLLFNAKNIFDELFFSNEEYKPIDYYASRIDVIIHILSDLLGVNATDDILVKIFSEFCVGK